MKLDVGQIFKYHPADEARGEKHQLVRAECLQLAQKLQEVMPESAEATLAIRKLQETMMYANAAIAIHS